MSGAERLPVSRRDHGSGQLAAAGGRGPLNLTVVSPRAWENGRSTRQRAPARWGGPPDPKPRPTGRVGRSGLLHHLATHLAGGKVLGMHVDVRVSVAEQRLQRVTGDTRARIL